MLKKLLKSNISIFLITLTIIGLITGFFYYSIQSNNTKNDLLESFSIKEELSTGVNNISKSSKLIVSTFINSITILPNIINIFNIFYKPFEYGFIFNLLSTYSIKLSLIFSITYYLIPLIARIILVIQGLSLSKRIIYLIIYKDKLNKIELFKYFKRYLITSSILLFYELIIILISSNINEYLIDLLRL